MYLLSVPENTECKALVCSYVLVEVVVLVYLLWMVQAVTYDYTYDQALSAEYS